MRRQFHGLPIALFIAICIVSGIPLQADAQRGVSYQELRQRTDRPNIYTDQVVLPGQGQEPLLIYTFRMDFDLLPFRRIQRDQNPPSDRYEYYSSVRMNLEVLEGQRAATRETWSGTAWAASFEETRSRKTHLEGVISTHLPPGEYRLRPQLDRSESPPQQQAAPRSRRNRDRPSASERTIQIPDFESLQTGRMVLLQSHNESDERISARLLNYGPAGLYGSDYQMLIVFPEREIQESYQLQVRKMRSGSDSETEGDPLYERSIEQEELFHTDGFEIGANTSEPSLEFERNSEGWRAVIVEIPNNRFPNSATMVTLLGSDDNQPYASRVVQSNWIGMPASLLNLDIAINKLRFMIGEDRVRQMQRGSASERERRFREFWAERDPTPETDYNELMIEYYSRIDTAFDMFTTPEQPGFDSDQGRAWILYGEPRSRERRYPTDSPTREVWTYPDRTLFFEATSGFGDFRLIREES